MYKLETSNLCFLKFKTDYYLHSIQIYTGTA